MEYGDFAWSRGRAEVRDKRFVALGKAEQRWIHVPEGKLEGAERVERSKRVSSAKGRGRSTRERTSGRVEEERKKESEVWGRGKEAECLVILVLDFGYDRTYI